jgi:hypothetical protein
LTLILTVPTLAAGGAVATDAGAGDAAGGTGLVDTDGVVGFPPELQLVTPNAAAMRRNGSARRDSRRFDVRDMIFFSRRPRRPFSPDSLRDSLPKATLRTGL